jgi:hypothetical protein
MDTANFWRKSLAFEPMVPDWALLALALALLLAAGLLWQASGTLAAGQRRVLGALRAVLLVGLFITLMGPVLRHERNSALLVRLNPSITPCSRAHLRAIKRAY